MTLTVPLVGMHFRPPAKQVLAVLPAGHRLYLRPKPENPYDAKAIQVLIKPGEIPDTVYSALEPTLIGTGSDLGDVIGLELMHLGYIADSEGAVCRKTGRQGNGDVQQAFDIKYPHEFTTTSTEEVWMTVGAKLVFFPDGAPGVQVDL